MRRIALLSIVVTAPTLAHAQQNPVRPAVQSITAEDVRARIGVLAHDSMRGRDTPSREIEKTAQYVADQFRAFGLRPGGEGGGYVQTYPIHRVRLDTAASRLEVAGGPTLGFPEHASQWLGSFAPNGVTGPTIVMSGVPSDDQLAAAPVEGAVVIFLGDLRTAFRIARAGAAALVVPVAVPDRDWAAQVAAQMQPTVRVPWRGSGGQPGVVVREAAITPILARHGVDIAERRADAAFHATPVPGLTLSVKLVPEVVERLTAPNTVGILEGGDPTLRNEYIVLSAHMDHVGVGRPVNGDSIYNGADDDASGTAAVIELAEAYAKLSPRPKRSMIFLTVSGEEHGLWGSDHFTAHPPVPIEQIVANFNIDMIGRNWDDTVVVIGKEHSDLGTTLHSVAARHPELSMEPIDDIWPEERFYFRSDHYNFARRGVPVLFFFTGTHEDYHRPGDHVEKIDVEKEVRIVKLIFYLGLEIANAAERPTWKPESYAEIVGN